MLNHTKTFPTFNSLLLHCFNTQDIDIAPDHALPRPRPVVMEDGLLEYVIDKIIDECYHGYSMQYLVI